MNILVINGSPKGATSNTFRLVEGILEGANQVADIHVETLTVRDMNVKPCMGCMSCWGKTAGKCVIQDEMQTVYEKIMDADIIIESFPLYFFGMPGPMKTFTDRCLPMMETYKGEVGTIGDNAFHESRYIMSGKKFLVVSTCGYGQTDEIFDALIKEFNFICGKGKYTAILCPQGEMMAIKQLEPQIQAYLERYRDIGRALGKGEVITEAMIARAAEPILPQRAFSTLVNNYWNSSL